MARNRQRLDALATRLTADTGRLVEVIVADLNDRDDLARIEQLLRDHSSISMLVNNAGIGAKTPLREDEIDKLDQMIDLNVTVLTRLTCAIIPAFVKRGGGAIINMASVVGIVPEVENGVYGGTKAFVLAFSLSLHKEFATSKIRVQAVLPGATATDFWQVAGTPLAEVPNHVVMQADHVVDAALAGFDQGELVTIPSLPDMADWETYEAARQNLIPKLSLRSPALRYGVIAA